MLLGRGLIIFSLYLLWSKLAINYSIISSVWFIIMFDSQKFSLEMIWEWKCICVLKHKITVLCLNVVEIVIHIYNDMEQIGLQVISMEIWSLGISLLDNLDLGRTSHGIIRRLTGRLQMSKLGFYTKLLHTIY